CDGISCVTTAFSSNLKSTKVNGVWFFNGEINPLLLPLYTRISYVSDLVLGTSSNSILCKKGCAHRFSGGNTNHTSSIRRFCLEVISSVWIIPFPAVISSKLPVFQSFSLPSKTKLKVSNPACGCAPPTGSPPGRFRLSSINKIKGSLSL